MNWRPIKTAPKGEQILLSYTGGDGETRYSGQGIWVDVPHNAWLMRQLNDGKRPEHNIKEKGHWEIGYVAILEHGGVWDGRTYEPRSWQPYDVTHWMPLPKPSTIRKRK